MNKIRYFLEVIKKLNALLDHKQKKKSIYVFLWMIVASLFEMLGVSVIVPFIYALLSPEELEKDYYVSTAMEILNVHSTMGMLIVLAVGIIIVYAVKNVLLLYSRYVQLKYQCQIQKDLSLFILESDMEHEYAYFVDTNSAEIMRGVLTDSETIFGILQNLFTMFAESITVFLLFVYIVISDWVIAIGMVIIAGVCILGITLGFKNIARSGGEKYRDSDIDRNKGILHITHGIKDILVLRRKDYFTTQFRNACEEYRKSRVIYYTLNITPERIIETLFVTGLLIIICIRIGQGASMASFVPKLASFAIIAFRLMPSINKFVTGINGIVYSIPALDAAYDSVMAAKDFMEKSEKTEKEGDDGHLSFDELFEVKDVTWGYADADKNVLEGASVVIHKGEAVAFIGESGSGKTTLADIILGLYEPKQGEILSDGKNVYKYLEQWSEYISYVPQSIYLTDDTVRANIVFGHYDINDDRIWNVLEQAQLKKFVESLPGGLDTMIGEEGVKLSGGQRQRLAIARALYTDPEILLLDEATAALDNETETAVMEAIDSLHGKKTLIIIAHRLSTIKNCNRVYQVKSGNIVDVTADFV